MAAVTSASCWLTMSADGTCMPQLHNPHRILRLDSSVMPIATRFGASVAAGSRYSARSRRSHRLAPPIPSTIQDPACSKSASRFFSVKGNNSVAAFESDDAAGNRLRTCGGIEFLLRRQRGKSRLLNRADFKRPIKPKRVDNGAGLAIAEVKAGKAHAVALQPDAPRKLLIDGTALCTAPPRRPLHHSWHRRSGWRDRRRSCLRACVAVAEGGLSGVRHLDPLRVGRGLRGVIVVPVPPLVGRALGVALRRVFPRLLAAKRRRIEVAPGAPHRLVAAAVDEVRAKHALAVAEEHVMAVPLIHTEVGVEAVGDGVPGHLPAHARL